MRGQRFFPADAKALAGDAGVWARQAPVPAAWAWWSAVLFAAGLRPERVMVLEALRAGVAAVDRDVRAPRVAWRSALQLLDCACSAAGAASLWESCSEDERVDLLRVLTGMVAGAAKGDAASRAVESLTRAVVRLAWRARQVRSSGRARLHIDTAHPSFPVGHATQSSGDPTRHSSPTGRIS